MVYIEIAVCNPIWILDASLLVAIGPELNRESSVRTITLIRFILIYIITARKQINRYNRIIIVTLRKHILRFLVRIHKSSSQRKFVRNGICTIIGNIVTVEVVIMNYPTGIVRRKGNIGFMILRSQLCPDTVRETHTRVKEICRIIIRRSLQLRPPTGKFIRTTSVRILQLWQEKWLVEIGIMGE